MKKTYMVTHEFKSPYVVGSGNPRNPIETRYKRFKKGELISGELKHNNNKPAFVLYNGVVVVPLSVIKAVVTKEILSSASGEEVNKIPNVLETTKNFVITKNPKTRYIDAAIFGALLGLGVVLIANKKGWIKVPASVNYGYGAGIGALAASYLIYRSNNKPKTQVK